MARDVPAVKTSVTASASPLIPIACHTRVMLSPPLLELLISVPLGRSTISRNAKKEKGAVSGTGCRADKIKNRWRGDLIGATQGEYDELVALPRNGHHPILDSGIRQRLLQPLRLPLQGGFFALGIQDEKRRSRGPDEIDRGGGLFPLIAAIHVPKAFFIVRQALSLSYVLSSVRSRAAPLTEMTPHTMLGERPVAFKSSGSSAKRVTSWAPAEWPARNKREACPPYSAICACTQAAARATSCGWWRQGTSGSNP